jgi:hypothetical protein
MRKKPAWVRDLPLLTTTQIAGVDRFYRQKMQTLKRSIGRWRQSSTR